jgi:Fe-S-cluster containining protein
MSNVSEIMGISDADLVEAREKVAFHRNGEFGEKYKEYLAKVSLALLEVYPPAREFSPTDLQDVVSISAICGEVSRGAKKLLKEACTGCGWCCSQTNRIVVEEQDTVRISHKLTRKPEDIFTKDGQDWMIKKANPCQWWNPKNGRCSIYNIRPQVCRLWPLWVDKRGRQTIQPMVKCNYAVMSLVNMIVWRILGAKST